MHSNALVTIRVLFNLTSYLSERHEAIATQAFSADTDFVTTVMDRPQELYCGLQRGATRLIFDVHDRLDYCHSTATSHDATSVTATLGTGQTRPLF